MGASAVGGGASWMVVAAMEGSGVEDWRGLRVVEN